MSDDGLARVADDEEGRDLDARLVVHAHGPLALVDRHLLLHEVERRLAAGFQPEIDAPAARRPHHAGRDRVYPVGARQAAPRQPERRHAPAELLQVVAVEREGVVGDPQAVVPEADDVVDLGEDRVERTAADGVAEDRLGAELAVVGTAQRGEQRRRTIAGGRPLALVGAVVEVGAVGQRVPGDLVLRVVHRRVGHAHAACLRDQAGVALQRQVPDRLRRDPTLQVVAAERREARVGLPAEDDVDVRQEAVREDGRQRTPRHQEGLRQTLTDRRGDAEGVAGEADHGRDPDDRRPPCHQIVEQLVERAERAVEDARRHAHPMEVGLEQRGTERREQDLGPRPGAEVREHQGHTSLLPEPRCLDHEPCLPAAAGASTSTALPRSDRRLQVTRQV